jgi:hypothetical protein
VTHDTTQQQITELTDAQAIAVLHLVLERQNGPIDHAELRQTEQRLAQALTVLQMQDLAVPDPAAGPGSLARTALTYLAARDTATRDLIDKAVTIPADPAERADPLTLTVGALVLLAFRTDLRLEHDPQKGWTFKLHTKPLSDSAIGKLLSQLLGTYLKP